MKSKGGDFEVTEEAFEEVMKNLEYKNKRSYDLIVKADNSYKRAMFGLCKRILSTEMIPKRFFNTQLVQLYKAKVLLKNYQIAGSCTSRTGFLECVSP